MEYLRERSALLEVKICDLRTDLYTQSSSAADKGIHLGGAQSAIVPMAALYYSGLFNYCLDEPTTEEQDIFLLSKGHAVAALAAVYADIGYIPKSALLNSRAWGAVVKGHPGPAIPGVPVATGPLGHGIGIACGFALRQKELGDFNTYVLLGDGELQEGSCWESMLFAAEHNLSNLCLIVDKNNGQSDDIQRLFINLDDMGKRFESFGFNVLYADSSNIPGLLTCYEKFLSYPRSNKPTVIICESYKGFGGYSVNAARHKASPMDEECNAELAFLKKRRDHIIGSMKLMDNNAINEHSESFGFMVKYSGGKIEGLNQVSKDIKTNQASPRKKSLHYNATLLPKIAVGQSAAPTDLGIAIARAFAYDTNFYSIDSDLSNVSGLYSGTSLTNRTHAINAGIAECNMMNMAESLAAVGANVWVSTFGPFFNMQAFRRICVSYQERQEVIESGKGWLSDGHNLDICFLSTASNLDTAVNGATHMSNDDINTVGQLAHVKIIDTSCPQQFLAVAKWIAEGNRGLVYLRVMRNASPALYDADFSFEYEKGYFLRGNEECEKIIVSSGHGVLEALAAADLLAKDGVAVVDMPSYDSALLRKLAEGGRSILFAEQNNGWLFDCFSRDCVRDNFQCDNKKIKQISTRDQKNKLQFIQSGTYEQLIAALGLCPDSIAAFL